MNLVSDNNTSTVLTEYKSISNKSTFYQSEETLEKELISVLISQGYERLFINNESDLISNLRLQLEKLNNYKFSDLEWEYLYSNILSNKNDYIVEKTKLIQENYIIISILLQ